MFCCCTGDPNFYQDLKLQETVEEQNKNRSPTLEGLATTPHQRATNRAATEDVRGTMLTTSAGVTIVYQSVTAQENSELNI